VYLNGFSDCQALKKKLRLASWQDNLMNEGQKHKLQGVKVASAFLPESRRCRTIGESGLADPGVRYPERCQGYGRLFQKQQGRMKGL
jgi:hypothetical protein